MRAREGARTLAADGVYCLAQPCPSPRCAMSDLPAPDPWASLLAHLPALSGRGLAALLYDHQRRCWGRGQGVPAEDYRDRLPLLREDDELLLDVVWGEVLCRQQRGEAPDPAEYERRFPH